MATEANLWTDDTEAKALLASLGANPPEGRWQRQSYALTRDEWFEYEGDRVTRLRAVRERAAGSVLRSCQHSGDYAAYRGFCDQPSVEDAIDAAIEAAMLAQVAA